MRVKKHTLERRLVNNQQRQRWMNWFDTPRGCKCIIYAQAHAARRARITARRNRRARARCARAIYEPKPKVQPVARILWPFTWVLPLSFWIFHTKCNAELRTSRKQNKSVYYIVSLGWKWNCFKQMWITNSCSFFAVWVVKSWVRFWSGF